MSVQIKEVYKATQKQRKRTRQPRGTYGFPVIKPVKQNNCNMETLWQLVVCD